MEAFLKEAKKYGIHTHNHFGEYVGLYINLITKNIVVSMLIQDGYHDFLEYTLISDREEEAAKELAFFESDEFKIWAKEEEKSKSRKYEII